MAAKDPSPGAAFDAHMMATALRLAERGLGRTAPNPSVGAVIADEVSCEVIARGWTAPGGRPHAETEAIARAGARARGATMYVTLEPCSHHGATPPCADAIIRAGIARVVCAVEDPDPRVAGRGLARLRQAGIAVERGMMAGEAHWMAAGHILRVTERRPFVQVKLALGADGSVPRGSQGRPAWVTGPAARAQGHLMRARADAVLVGRQTVIDDDPLLTCRLPGLAHRSPVRVVLARNLSGLHESRLARGASRTPAVDLLHAGRRRGAARGGRRAHIPCPRGRGCAVVAGRDGDARCPRADARACRRRPHDVARFRACRPRGRGGAVLRARRGRSALRSGRRRPAAALPTGGKRAALRSSNGWR